MDTDKEAREGAVPAEDIIRSGVDPAELEERGALVASYQLRVTIREAVRTPEHQAVFGEDIVPQPVDLTNDQLADIVKEVVEQATRRTVRVRSERLDQ